MTTTDLPALPPIDPHARTIVASHTNLQVACATARAALLAWTRAQPKADGPTRLRAFIEAVHAHDLVARIDHDRADSWRRRLASAVEIGFLHAPYRRAAKDARERAARLAR